MTFVYVIGPDEGPQKIGATGNPANLYKWRQAIRPDPQIDDPESET